MKYQISICTLGFELTLFCDDYYMLAEHVIPTKDTKKLSKKQFSKTLNDVRANYNLLEF
jgi:hypothetical protein